MSLALAAALAALTAAADAAPSVFVLHGEASEALVLEPPLPGNDSGQDGDKGATAESACGQEGNGISPRRSGGRR